MKSEAAKAGMYDYAGVSYPRIQLLTIREIVGDKRDFQTPTKVGSRIATGQAVLPMEGVTYQPRKRREIPLAAEGKGLYGLSDSEDEPF
jgi:hypothetical protein